MPATPSSILALDVGTKRVGLALASSEARLASPLKTLVMDDDFFTRLAEIIETEAVAAIVVGLPRGLEGQHTAQTTAVEDFIVKLRQQIDLPMYLQDEALTSVRAEEELESRGKPYHREAIDALAATYILEDYLAGQKIRASA